MPERTAVQSEVQIDGVRIAYESMGQGPALICCHAFAADRTMWRPQIERFSQSHRLITFDQRGSGASDHPSHVEGEADPYTIDTFADDVRAILDDLEIERARVLGLSMGAASAMRFAIRWPERVEKLVLASSMASRLPEKIIERSKAVLDVLEREGLEETYRFYFSGPLFRGVNQGGELPSMLATFAARATPQGFKGCYRVTIDRPSMADELHRITAPTLILVGEHDAHYLDEADLMKQRIPKAEKVVVPGVGHAMSTEAPDLFSDEVLRFLGR
jgi:pimeloyl-ACP methyl ester carboxylesterase